MAYRDGPHVARNEREEAAINALVARTKLVRAIVIVTHILAGAVLGAFLYDLLRDFQLARRGGHSPYVTGMIAMVPTFGSCLRLAPHVARLVTKALLPGWRRSLAKKYGLDLATFEEITTLLTP